MNPNSRKQTCNSTSG